MNKKEFQIQRALGALQISFPIYAYDHYEIIINNCEYKIPSSAFDIAYKTYDCVNTCLDYIEKHRLK